jgi:anti-anti-sigma regulatory factor
MISAGRLPLRGKDMHLSIEAKRQSGSSVYVCRGKLVEGSASEYLFDLLTRSQHRDVILDLADVTAIDEAGLRAVALSCQFLTGSGGRLFLRHAPSDLVEHLRKHGAPVLEWPAVRAATLAATVSNRAGR